MLLIFSILALIISFRLIPNFFQLGEFYIMQIGLLLEFIFFNFAISYKTHLLYKERGFIYNRLVSTLLENERLSKDKEKELQQKIEETALKVKKAEKEQLLTEFALSQISF
ncbi:MAG: hypothetical protein RLZZ546_2194 [Bacteroidota bacterium]